MIRAGEALVVPVPRKGKVYEAFITDNNITTPKAKPPPNSKSTLYTIESGDSLWKIAQHFNLRVKDLVYWNGIRKSKILRPGQTLIIWVSEDLPATTNAANRVVTVTDNKNHLNYTVEVGDSLWKIARRFKVTINSLRRWNQLGEGKLIRPGQLLKLHVSSLTHSASS